MTASIPTSEFEERTDPLCRPGAEAGPGLARAPWSRFAVMGDSFAAGTGSPSPGYADRSWPDRVADVLRTGHPELAYLNTGAGGARTAEVRRTQLERVLAFGPDLVNVAAGGNDVFGATVDLDAVEGELDAVYRALTDQGATVFAFTVTDVFSTRPELSGFRDRVDALNGRIRAVAGRYGAVLVEMWQHPVRLRPSLIGTDGIHFSREGHAVLAAEVLRALAGRMG